VSALINQRVNWWNVPLVEAIFSGHKAAEICSMALFPCSQVDKLIWAGTKNGGFLMRGAYHLEVERRRIDQGCCSSNPDIHPVWKIIWKLRIPRAILLFLWHGCNDILPTREKLYHRKVVSDPFCQQCGVEVETSGHVLWQCRAASAIWACGPRVVQKCVMAKCDFLR
jgi:hypothetical protein